ncbi:MAG: serine protease [Methylobacter sp.]|nr:serine protease [Methylobacter sp.]MDP2099044.1 serine protease [Methylobacter sp.]MDP2428265.1 serine protease [Methylobacter sp.]MDP3055232.1 serine protease [Methylobacter sp.]MDP3362063.1 serine protease [Methylobacter sp.]
MKRFLCCLGVLLTGIAQAQPVARIINGVPASTATYPWIGDLDGCAGTLIAPQWVLTAAHCFNNATDTAVNFSLEHRLPVQFLSDNIIRVSDQVVEVKAVELIPHPDYNPRRGFNNDIALLKLATPVNHIPVATLMSAPSIAVNTPMVAIGRGATEVNDDNQAVKSSEILLKADLFTVSNAVCKQAYLSEGETITDNMLCLSGFSSDDRSDTCSGDSGGPVFIEADNQATVQAGIISFGGSTKTRICSNPDLPSVYTRVSRYQSWIKQHVPEAKFAQSASAKFPASCKTQLDPNLNVAMPCLIFEGQVYSTHLWLVDTNLTWLWSGQLAASACPANPHYCVSVDNDLTLNFRNLTLDGSQYKATLSYSPAVEGHHWRYSNHEPE